MSELLAAITDLVSNTPPSKIKQLSELLKRSSEDDLDKVLDVWPSAPAAKQRLRLIVGVSAANGVLANELAGMLVGASFAHNKVRGEETIELVWTGPSSALIATRKTEQALLQVIKAAHARLFLTSFVAYDVTSILTALSDATERGVSVSMLLEASEADGGGLSIDVIDRMRQALPAISVFSWKDRTDAFSGGKVHAKVAVADEQTCFVSSANLTGHAMEKNMEAGVLISGGDTPRKLHRHLEALVKTRVITQV